MKISFLTFLSVIVFTSCTGRTGAQSAINVSTGADESVAITKSAKSFYDWCFNNEFPYYEVVRGKNEKCKLDTASYFSKLRALGTISEQFIAQEKRRVKDCADFMSSVDYTAYEAADAYEYDTHCSDLYYMYWIKSQEIPNSFAIKSVKQNGPRDATADVYVNYGGTDEYLTTISLQKEQRIWKITQIKTIDKDLASLVEARVLIEDFIPQGWKTILHESGDLNKDGIDDHVIVIEDTKNENIKTNDGLGQDTLNVNPRMIMVFFKEKDNGYTLVAQNAIGFIPPENDEESTCLADPLMTEGGIGIQKGILTISFQYWLSCGSWYVNNADYKFRYQDREMELIGFDHSEFHRASGEQSSTSINLSTKQMEHTTGYNMFEDSISKPKTTKSKWKGGKRYTLDQCSPDTYSELLDIK
ncbi:hypothetical protein [Sphingobacterium tabacisoli]|uniref:DUF3828 domain-containing protein n=1 Tax=Sphingobacterium tabacisoli TaxID=2044855 RepID=A0ABW5L0U9_9SPHI|nr:hypothetical protein [Sphingobacterium tabacisoli]